LSNSKFWRNALDRVKVNRAHAYDYQESVLRPGANCPECGADVVGYTRRDDLPWAICEKRHLFTAFGVSMDKWYTSSAEDESAMLIDMRALCKGDLMDVEVDDKNYLILRQK